MKIINLMLYRKKLFLLIIFVGIIACPIVMAQEYKYEIGGGVGMSMYMGDANKNDFFREWHPAAGVVWRKNTNFRWAIKTDLMIGKVSGDTQQDKNVFPGGLQTSFDHMFYELGGQMEFNFLPYSDKYAYLQTSRITPYLLAGFGLTYAPTDESFFGLNLPVGIGVKYKIKNRVNLGLEYSFRKLFNDGFDSSKLEDPYTMNSGLFKNKDWYSVLLFTLTWDFGPNNRACTNLN